SAGTIRLYLLHVAAFAEHFHRSPDQLGAEHIRQYQLFLIQEKKLAWSSDNQIVCALAFLLWEDLEAGISAAGHSLSTQGAAISSDPQPGGSGTDTHRTSASQKSCPVDDHLRRRLAALRGGPFTSQRHRLGTHDHHRPSRQRAEGSPGDVVPGLVGYLAAVLA